MKKIVWIVTNEADVCAELRRLLIILGYKVRVFEEAHTPAHALLTEDIPDLMIVDDHVPAVDGLDLLSYIRRTPRWVHLPVILISSESGDRCAERVTGVTADADMSTPIAIEALQIAIRTATRRRRAVASQK